jgi:hypothetical protein
VLLAGRFLALLAAGLLRLFGGAGEVKGEKVFEDLFVRQIGGPAVGGVESLVRVIEVFFLALVFQSEAVIFPHIRKAALRRFAGVWRLLHREKLRVFDGALLKAEKIRTGGIGLRWRRLVEQMAKVVEVLLVRGRFFRL